MKLTPVLPSQKPVGAVLELDAYETNLLKDYMKKLKEQFSFAEELHKELTQQGF
jgi:hypothetical protein